MDKDLRTQLVAYIQGKHAHMDLNDAVRDFPLTRINDTAPNSSYTPYRLLEHIRITQWDIIEFIKNPKYKYLKWPDDYWPKAGKRATAHDWKESVRKYNSDLKELVRLVKNPRYDLMKKIPHGTGQTFFKEVLVVIDHNSYHIGEFGMLRDVMKTWGKKKSAI